MRHICYRTCKIYLSNTASISMPDELSNSLYLMHSVFETSNCTNNMDMIYLTRPCTLPLNNKYTNMFNNSQSTGTLKKLTKHSGRN